MSEDRALYNANDGLTGRDGGPYLDQQEDITAEIRRAKIEGREPDLDNPPASAGTVLVTAAQAIANLGVNNLPSQSDNSALGAEAAVKAIADDETNTLKVAAVVPAEVYEDAEPTADLSMRASLAGDETVNLPEADESEDDANAEPVFGDTEADVTESDTTRDA